MGGEKVELPGEGAPLFVRSRCHCSRLPLLIHFLHTHVLCLSFPHLNEIELQQEFDQTKVRISGEKRGHRHNRESHVSLCFLCLESVTGMSLIICGNMFFLSSYLHCLSFCKTATFVNCDELLKLCNWVFVSACFCQGVVMAHREGTRHPNLIQTHSSPEGIEGEWGLGEQFPKRRGSSLAFIALLWTNGVGMTKLCSHFIGDLRWKNVWFGTKNTIQPLKTFNVMLSSYKKVTQR